MIHGAHKIKPIRKAYCVKCKISFEYRGCRCRAKCPNCGEKGSSVKVDNNGKIYF